LDSPCARSAKTIELFDDNFEVLLLDQSGHRNVRPANSQEAQDDGLRVLKLHEVASVGLEHFLDPEDRVELSHIGIGYNERNVHDVLN
jgi:hypothetical protein